MKIATTPIVLCFVSLLIAMTMTNCTDTKEAEKALAQTELNELIQERTTLSQSIAEQKRVLTSQYYYLNAAKQQLRNLKTNVNAYVDDHPSEQACVVFGLGGAALATDNSFSQNIQTAGEIAFYACTLYAITHADEVVDFVTNLNEADKQAKYLQRNIQIYENNIQNASQNLNNLDSNFKALSESIGQKKVALSSI